MPLDQLSSRIVACPAHLCIRTENGNSHSLISERSANDGDETCAAESEPDRHPLRASLGPPSQWNTNPGAKGKISLPCGQRLRGCYTLHAGICCLGTPAIRLPLRANGSYGTLAATDNGPPGRIVLVEHWRLGDNAPHTAFVRAPSCRTGA